MQDKKEAVELSDSLKALSECPELITIVFTTVTKRLERASQVLREVVAELEQKKA